jgi:hypothetical protein
VNWDTVYRSTVKRGRAGRTWIGTLSFITSTIRRQHFLAAGEPVISVDTKRKDLSYASRSLLRSTDALSMIHILVSAIVGPMFGSGQCSPSAINSQKTVHCKVFATSTAFSSCAALPVGQASSERSAGSVRKMPVVFQHLSWPLQITNPDNPSTQTSMIPRETIRSPVCWICLCRRIAAESRHGESR